MSSTSVVSTPLPALFQVKYVCLLCDALLRECDITFTKLTLNQEQARNIELYTRGQELSKDWFRYRTGRVTASRLQSFVPTRPSISLIKAICYPESTQFSTKATRWGCEHEKTAQEAYLQKIVGEHSDLSISDRGLVIDPRYPHLGATPDGFITCSCCGSGVVEVKCPFCCTEKSFSEASSSSSFSLESTGDGSFKLKETHAYFYQIQLQMRLCEVKYGDFVILSEQELIVLRIAVDDELLDCAIEQATHFLRHCLLSELLGKWYTRAPGVQDTAHISTTNKQSNKFQCRIILVLTDAYDIVTSN